MVSNPGLHLGRGRRFRVIKIGVKPFCAFGAQAVGKFRLRMLADIILDPVPIAGVVADLLASGTNGQQAAQRLYLGKGLAQLPDQSFAFFFCNCSLTDLPLQGLVCIEKFGRPFSDLRLLCQSPMQTKYFLYSI